MTDRTKDIIFYITSFVLAAVTGLFAFLAKPLLGELLFILALILTMAVFAVVVILKVKEKESISKLFFIAQFLLLIVLLFAFIFHKSGILDKVKSVEELRKYIEQFSYVKYAYIGMQFLQVTLLPIPSTVTILAGLLLFPPWEVVLYSLIGIIPGSILMFLFGRYAGRKALNWALGKEQIDKYLNVIKGKDVSVLTTMFVLPLFPDDTICAIAGLSTMKLGYFIPVITVTRIVSCIYTAFLLSGEVIPFSGWGIIAWIAIVALVAVLLVFMWKKGDVIQEKVTNFFSKKLKKKNEVSNKNESSNEK